ncbi:MAG: hypothetical protein AAFR38_10810 [Planctomycetota bacterium]
MLARTLAVVAGMAGMASAQSATVSLTPASSSIAPGESTVVQVDVSYDLAGASGGLFGAGLFGYGFDASDDNIESQLASPSVSPSLPSGSVASVNGSMLRFGGGVGLMPPILGNPFNLGSFTVSADAGASDGSVTVTLDGTVLLSRGDEINSVSSSPGANQFQLPPASVTISIMASAGCNQFDLVEPFGVLSQADVAEFVNLFFANSPIVAVYAAPTDVVSQADVSAFVDGFFAGCPTN